MNIGDLFMIPDSIIMTITWILGTLTHALSAAGGYGSLALGSL